MSYKLNDQMIPGVSQGRVRSAGRAGANVGISLAKRRRWYADEDVVKPDEKQPGADDKLGDGKDDDKSNGDLPENVENLPPWAQKIIKDTRAEAAANRTKLRDAELAQQDAERKKAEEQGKYKELWEEAQPKLQRLTQLEEGEAARRTELNERNEKRLKELPSDKQKIASSLLDKIGDDPYKRAAALDELIPTLVAAPNPPGLDGGSKGNSKDKSPSKVELKKASY